MRKISTRRITSLGEFGLIDRFDKLLQYDASVVRGVGDDCAVLKKDKYTYELFTTDLTVEDVHFQKKKVTPFAVGYKALARNLSDIAAMGGVAHHAVVALGLPKSMTIRSVDGLYSGIKKCASAFGLSVVGGDISRSQRIVVAISVLGTVEKRNVILRSGARVGDIVVTTGTFGGSMLKKHVTFTPRIKEARFLTTTFSIHAMIDVSDGLVQDVGHIMRASRVGCIIDGERVPVSSDALKLTHRNYEKARERALHDGEDFELLFTVSPQTSTLLYERWRKVFNTPLTAIGRVVKGRQVIIKRGKTEEKISSARQGYMHF